MKKIIKQIWHNHMLLMLICCLVPLGIIYGGIYFFGWNNSMLTWSILIICPLAHLFLMKDHMHHNHEQKRGEIYDK